MARKHRLSTDTSAGKKRREDNKRRGECLLVQSTIPTHDQWNTRNISPIVISVARPVTRQRILLRLDLRTGRNMKLGNAFRTVVVTIFVAVSLCAAARTGWASCGDYLHTKHSEPESDGQQDQQHSNPANTSSKMANHSQPDPKSPCNGPFCRNGNSADAPFAPASVELRTSAAPCCGLHVSMIESSSAQRTVFATRARKLQGYPGTIDHPPKTVC